MPVERDPSKVDFTKDGNFKLYPDEPLSFENKKKYLTREQTQFFDPCMEASKMSMNCLDRNNYDRSKCKPYFEAYRDCMKAWRENRHKWNE